jgi:hypothetical protein
MAWWMAIPAAIGAIAGGVSVKQNSEREQQALRKQQDTAWQQYLLGKELGDAQYTIQRGEAQFQADRAHHRLDQSVDMSIEQMNTSLLAQAFGIQDAHIQSASSIGASRAAEGAGGTRGGGAGELIRAYAAQSLERNIDIQNQRNDQALRGLTTEADNAMADIVHERNSWDPGGHRFQQKEAQDAYALGMARLEQGNYDWQLDQSKPAFLDYATGVLGGASSGMSLANSMYEFDKAHNVSGSLKDAWNTVLNGGRDKSLGITSYMTDYSNQLGINSNTFIKNYWGNKL